MCSSQQTNQRLKCVQVAMKFERAPLRIVRPLLKDRQLDESGPLNAEFTSALEFRFGGKSTCARYLLTEK